MELVDKVAEELRAYRHSPMASCDLAAHILAIPEIRDGKREPPLSSQIDVIAKNLAHRGQMDDVRVLHHAAQIIEDTQA